MTGTVTSTSGTLGPMDALREHLLDAGYTLDAVTDRLGEAGVAALARNTTPAASDALGAARDPQATLCRLWLLQDDVPHADLAEAVGDPRRLAALGLLEPGRDPGTWRASVEVRPFGTDDGFDGWVCHDRLPTLDGRLDPAPSDFVLGLSPASTTLAQLTIRDRVGRALDLGTGCGVQSLHLARHADVVVATDLNPRAVALARVTARLNGVDLDVRTGSLYEPVAGERFDLIVTNPPYVMSPPTGERLVYREGLFTGDDLVRRVVTEGAGLLAEGGVLQVLGNWAIVASEPFEDRLRSWIEPTGCDALVLMRERLDPYEYIEVWLNDAGLVGSPDYTARYRAWLDYFAGLGIEGVGLGWIALRNAGRATPHVQVEEWPHAVHQPVGEAFSSFFRGLDAAADASDAALLATAWTLDPRVTQETLGRPGAEDPEHVVLRQGYGLGRAIEVDTALGAVLGACDGELSAGRLVAAVAQLLEVDAGALASEVAPRLRQLVIDGWMS